uniref:Uncharacterized protein n=1 Tax=Frankia alni (strain DSM 45986 / CECT 9034 / ACN14a) TaxID=326424 RepID=Q70Z06_FRAAA|nr:hypothetical protein [Frankia alni ACN14a]
MRDVAAWVAAPPDQGMAPPDGGTGPADRGVGPAGPVPWTVTGCDRTAGTCTRRGGPSRSCRRAPRSGGPVRGRPAGRGPPPRGRTRAPSSTRCARTDGYRIRLLPAGGARVADSGRAIARRWSGGPVGALAGGHVDHRVGGSVVAEQPTRRLGGGAQWSAVGIGAGVGERGISRAGAVGLLPMGASTARPARTGPATTGGRILPENLGGSVEEAVVGRLRLAESGVAPGDGGGGTWVPGGGWVRDGKGRDGVICDGEVCDGEVCDGELHHGQGRGGQGRVAAHPFDGQRRAVGRRRRGRVRREPPGIEMPDGDRQSRRATGTTPALRRRAR